MENLLTGPAAWLKGKVTWESAVLVLLIVVAPFLTFYNLEYNPRPWHDEGSYLALAKTLVTDNVYAVHSSDGYQTFGAVQSVGPTVLLPIALSFKLLGVGVLQGRIVAGIFALLTLAVFYSCGLVLFGRRTALISIILLLASPAVGFFLYGRPAFGEIPALGFLLGGLACLGRRRSFRSALVDPIAGLLIGAAMVTKSHIPLSWGPPRSRCLSSWISFTFVRVSFGGLLVVGLVALGCVAAWWLWQLAYFGEATFQENAAKMRRTRQQYDGVSSSHDDRSDQITGRPCHGILLLLLGVPGLIYVGFMCMHRNKDAVILSFLWLFACLWLGLLHLLDHPLVALPDSRRSDHCSLCWQIVLRSVGRFGRIRTKSFGERVAAPQTQLDLPPRL